ncbi:hypothetical protein [Streptomyces sp. AC550_RSS872]|nr:hypothetical protein [Streptomyces sp. AC550_RSS872]
MEKGEDSETPSARCTLRLRVSAEPGAEEALHGRMELSARTP